MTRERLANRRGIDIVRRGREGRASPDKGARIEGALVAAPSAKPWLRRRTGAVLRGRAGRFGGEVFMPLLGLDRRVQVKGRANGLAKLCGWPAGADVLMIGTDPKEPLVVLPLGLAAEIAGGGGAIGPGRVPRGVSAMRGP